MSIQNPLDISLSEFIIPSPSLPDNVIETDDQLNQTDNDTATSSPLEAGKLIRGVTNTCTPNPLIDLGHSPPSPSSPSEVGPLIRHDHIDTCVSKPAPPPPITAASQPLGGFERVLNPNTRKCEVCGKAFHKNSLARHIKDAHTDKVLKGLITEVHHNYSVLVNRINGIHAVNQNMAGGNFPIHVHFSREKELCKDRKCHERK